MQQGDKTLSRFDYDSLDDDADDTAFYARKFKLEGARQRHRTPKPHHKPKKTEQQIISEIVDSRIGLEGGLQTTYKPRKDSQEEVWLTDSLRPFFDQSLITDVLAKVKGGKEASVYCCTAHPTLGTDLLAAKIYRPRMFRNLRNDRLYREGRTVLSLDGKEVRDDRSIRALSKKTKFGAQVAHTSWLMHEFKVLDALLRGGAAVPRPYAAGENGILMTYIGDERIPAPTLHEVGLADDEVQPFFEEVLRNIALMLQHGMVHGDLSPYNILYWEGDLTLIDFPQVTECRTNRAAYRLLARDVERVCGYFAEYGVRASPKAIAEQLWQQHVQAPMDRLANDPDPEVLEDLLSDMDEEE